METAAEPSIDAAASDLPIYGLPRRQVGTLLVLVVVGLYVGSGVMIQVLFDEMQYEKPFFFSFVSVGLCSTYLLQHVAIECRRTLFPPQQGTYSKVDSNTSGGGIGSPLQLLRPAMLLAPSYFCLNYTYFFSLDMTTVSSTMILSASTGVWTLLFSRLLLGETLTRLKLVTVSVSLLGMSLVVLSAHSSSAAPAAATPGSAAAAAAAASKTPQPAAAAAAAEDTSGITGDVLALMSAAASGVYMVLLPVCVPEGEAVHMPSLFGMMGLVCTLVLLPLFPLLHYGGVEYFELPPTRSATLSLLVNAATSTVLPDMLLAKAIMMTSPLVATLGLSLMIPFSVFADYMRGLANLSPQFFIGTFAVFVGFVLETMGEAEEKVDDPEGVMAEEPKEGEVDVELVEAEADSVAAQMEAAADEPHEPLVRKSPKSSPQPARAKSKSSPKR